MKPVASAGPSSEIKVTEDIVPTSTLSGTSCSVGASSFFHMPTTICPKIVAVLSPLNVLGSQSTGTCTHVQGVLKSIIEKKIDIDVPIQKCMCSFFQGGGVWGEM